MKVVARGKPGGVLLEAPVFTDGRGSLSVSWAAHSLSDLVGEPVEFRQLNTLRSGYGVARGIHYRVSGDQGKLVYPLIGRHWSVAVDMRPESPTQGAWFGSWLVPEKAQAFWVPPGFGHGMVCLAEAGLLQYLSTTEFDPELERGLALDADVGVDWPIAVRDMRAKAEDFRVKTMGEFWEGA